MNNWLLEHTNQELQTALDSLYSWEVFDRNRDSALIQAVHLDWSLSSELHHLAEYEWDRVAAILAWCLR